MPTPTYFNLPKEKREAIEQASILEFANHTFSEASINQIVKASNISRGSFYQYFEDKEDCYLHILTMIAKEKMKLFGTIVNRSEQDSIFDEYEQMLEATIEWIKQKPLYYQMGMYMDMDDSEFIQKLIRRNQTSMDYFIQLVKRDQDRGLIKSSINPVVLVDMLWSINRNTLMQFYLKQDFDGMRIHVKEMIAIIKGGAMYV